MRRIPKAAGMARMAWSVAVVAGFSYGCSAGGSAERGPSRRAPQAIPVAAIETQPRSLARVVTVTGPVEPIRTVSVNALAAGTVLRVLVEEGNVVRRGQLLAELDGREVAAQLQRARAILANAEAEYRRAEQLRAGGLNSAAALDVARSAFETARADADLWQTRFDFTRITAPVAGVVTAKRVERGGAVSANDTMFDVADVSQLVVRVQISELDVVRLEPGRAVTLQLDAYPHMRVAGRIRRIFPSAEPASRLVPVEVVLGAAPRGVIVRPGFLARVELALEERTNVLAVPAAAIGTSEGALFVYVIEADTLSRRPVVAGLTAGGWIEVTRGLAVGEQVVSSGHANLRPGAVVRIVGDRM